jgi:hypothetical protein
MVNGEGPFLRVPEGPAPPSVPFFLVQSFDRWCIWVARLDPQQRSAALISRAELFGDEPFKAERSYPAKATSGGSSIARQHHRLSELNALVATLVNCR